MLQEIWLPLPAKGQLVNLVTAGKQTKFENLNAFSGRSAGDRIYQILRSGGWFTPMQRPDESSVLKIDPGSTRCWRAARAFPGLLGDVLQQAQWAWSVTRERKTLIKCEAKSCCEQTIETSKMLEKPVTFLERAVISLCISQIYSLEVGQRIVPLPILWTKWGFFWASFYLFIFLF